MHVFDRKNWISIFCVPYFPVLPFRARVREKVLAWINQNTCQNACDTWLSKCVSIRVFPVVAFVHSLPGRGFEKSGMQEWAKKAFGWNKKDWSACVLSLMRVRGFKCVSIRVRIKAWCASPECFPAQHISAKLRSHRDVHQRTQNRQYRKIGNSKKWKFSFFHQRHALSTSFDIFVVTL